VTETVAPPRRGRTALIASGVVLVVLALFIGVLATRKPSTDRRVSTPLAGQPAPELDGPTLQGTPVDLASYQGQWLIVNFFATWCVPCQKEHPELDRWSRAHAKAGDGALVSVVFQDKAAAVRDFFRRRGGDWPVVRDDDGALTVAYGVSGVPESFLVAPSGVVVTKIEGGVTAAGLDRLIADIEREAKAAK
jgi:cytochrome c biogenesis protein CcmG/thiol:disulfide interchange protein DsbE